MDTDRAPKEVVKKAKEIGQKRASGIDAKDAFKNYKHTMDDWTPKQQKAFEAALKLAKKFNPTERWDKITAMVPGRTKSECLARYKKIKAQIESKKRRNNK